MLHTVHYARNSTDRGTRPLDSTGQSQAHNQNVALEQQEKDAEKSIRVSYVHPRAAVHPNLPWLWQGRSHLTVARGQLWVAERDHLNV